MCIVSSVCWGGVGWGRGGEGYFQHGLLLQFSYYTPHSLPELTWQHSEKATYVPCSTELTVSVRNTRGRDSDYTETTGLTNHAITLRDVIVTVARRLCRRRGSSVTMLCTCT